MTFNEFFVGIDKKIIYEFVLVLDWKQSNMRLHVMDFNCFKGCHDECCGESYARLHADFFCKSAMKFPAHKHIRDYRLSNFFRRYQQFETCLTQSVSTLKIAWFLPCDKKFLKLLSLWSRFDLVPISDLKARNLTAC